MPKKPHRLFAHVHRLYQKPSFRYLGVGGTVYLLELVIIVVAQRWGASPEIAVAAAFLIGTAVSFFLQKLFTFRDRRMHHRIVLSQAIAVGLLILFNLSFTIMITHLLAPWLPAAVTRTGALLITTIWNFYLYKTRIFNPHPQRKVPTERPGVLLRFETKKALASAAEAFTPDVPHEDDRRHSLRMVILCLLILLALVMGGWVVSTLQQAIAHGHARTSAAAGGPRPQPLQVDGLSAVNCKGRTVLQVVAHADDDLAFINPDTQASLDASQCVRTIYLTAADHGWGMQYAEEREAGIQDAYSVMLGDTTGWKPQTVLLPDGQPVHVYTSLDDIPAAAVIFLRLPDGNLGGEGFLSTGEVSLKKLLDGTAPELTSVDGEAAYTKQTLLKTLAQFIAVYQPVVIRTLGDTSADVLGDHNDHFVTGELTTMALKQYRDTYRDTTDIPLIKYIGYPIAGRAANLSADEEAKKAEAFFAYAQHDANVCQTREVCESGDSSYAKYLSRRYTLPRK